MFGYADFIIIILLLVLACLVDYQRLKTLILEKALEYIVEAEFDPAHTGPEKMARVVKKLALEIPAIFSKIIFTPERLQEIAQRTYNEIYKLKAEKKDALK